MEFEQKGFLQWEIALRENPHPLIEASFLTVNPDLIKKYPIDNLYWNPIRNADVVFVRCVRVNLNWEWYKLPLIVKLWMCPKAKMICQFDMDLLWLFHPYHYAWSAEVPWARRKSPKRFLKETGILQIANCYNLDYNPLLEKLISKPAYHVYLPQLVRYKEYLSKINEPKSKRLILLRHSVHSASVDNTIENVINNPVEIFMCKSLSANQKVGLSLKLPPRSIIHERMRRDAYMFYLKKGYVAIDDNEDYYGWSRFAMECALAEVPCVGSTPAVKMFFPELYTKRNAYKRQKHLIKKLYEDKEFWLEMAKTGKERVLKEIDTKSQIEKLVKVIRGLMNEET